MEATTRVTTAFGLGGEGVLRTHGRDAEATAVIRAAIALGVRYFDSARAYAGRQRYDGGVWPLDAKARAQVFITSKSASRDAEGARRDLAKTLATMKVGHLDLWQIHDVRTDEELRTISGKGGALEAFLEAKRDGKIRRIGVTGHHDPDVLLRAVRELPVETVLLPVNVAEGALRREGKGGFLDRVLPAARERGLAVIGMKVLGGGTWVQSRERLSADELVRWSLRQGADTLIIGCSSPDEVQQNVASVARGPLDDDAATALEARIRERARELAYYRGRF